MLLMVEKGIRGGICQAIHRYAKTNNKYMKYLHKNIESSYLIYLHANSLYGWQCLKNFLEMVPNGKEAFINLMKTL